MPNDHLRKDEHGIPPPIVIGFSVGYCLLDGGYPFGDLWCPLF